MLRRSTVWLVIGVLSFMAFACIVEAVKGEECKISTEGTSVRKHQVSDSGVKSDSPTAPRKVRGFKNLSVYYEEVDGARVLKIAERPEFTFVPAPSDRGGAQK